MAALIKLRQMSVMQRCALNHFNRLNRNISTSKKNRDTASATTAAAECAIPEDKNWVSYGFSYESKEEDTNVHHATFFFSISLCLVFGGFLWAYAPDVHMRDWAQREAFLELRRREKLGLRPVDPNYIDPKLMKLPAEKDLCDVEIII